MAVDIPSVARGSTWPVTITIAAILRCKGYDATVLVAMTLGCFAYALACVWDQLTGDMQPRAALSIAGPAALCAWLGALVGAVYAQDGDLPWYRAYYTDGDAFLYSALGILLYIVMYNVWAFCHACATLKARSGSRVPLAVVANGPYLFFIANSGHEPNAPSLVDAVYARRCAIMNGVSAICAGFAVYYMDIVIRFVSENPSINMIDTTYYSSANKTQCSTRDNVVTAADDALYSEVQFVDECAVVVWARNRTNLLVWTQASVVFSLLVDVPYLSKKVHTSYRAWYVLTMVVGNAALVAAVITTLDLLTAWYDITTSGAVLFTIYGVTRVVGSLIQQSFKSLSCTKKHDETYAAFVDDVKLKL